MAARQSWTAAEPHRLAVPLLSIADGLRAPTVAGFYAFARAAEAIRACINQLRETGCCMVTPSVVEVIARKPRR